MSNSHSFLVVATHRKLKGILEKSVLFNVPARLQLILIIYLF